MAIQNKFIPLPGETGRVGKAFASVRRTINPTHCVEENPIAAEVRVCTLCDLYKGPTRAVPGAGNSHAGIRFIGEVPGYNEDKQGLPFVGRSGDCLNELIRSIGLRTIRCSSPI